MMTLVEMLTLVGTLLNTGILTSIYYKLGKHDEKHKNHENRLTALEEGKIYVCASKRT